MNHLLYILIFFSNILIAQTENSNGLDTPIGKIDFSKNDWIIDVETWQENLHKQNYEITHHIISDENTLDSLKTEFKCSLKKQSEGRPNTYKIKIYKNNKILDYLVFDDTNNFNFGRLKPNFQERKLTDTILIKGNNDLEQIINNLKSNQTDFFYSSEYDGSKFNINGIEIPDGNIDSLFPYTYTLEVSFNNLDKIGIETQKAIDALHDIFPMNRNNYFIYNIGGNKIKNGLRYYTIKMGCKKDFSLNEQKLKRDNNVFQYEIIGRRDLKYYLFEFKE